jgi:elongation factor Ts
MTHVGSSGTGYQPSAAEVKALRDRTGLPMMDCKRALMEAGGDPEKAIEILRRQGEKVSVKKAGRETAEGRIEIFRSPDNEVLGLAVVLCEQAPSAKNERFVHLVRTLAKQVALLPQQPTPEAVLAAPLLDEPARTGRDLLLETINLIRENIQLSVVARMRRDGGVLGAYVHFNYQEAAMVRMVGPAATRELADEVAANIVAFKPRVVDRSEISPEEIAREKAILRDAVLQELVQQGKPEHLADRIVEGKLVQEFFAEHVALDQPYVRNPKLTLGAYLKQKGDVRIVEFRRFRVGET